MRALAASLQPHGASSLVAMMYACVFCKAVSAQLGNHISKYFVPRQVLESHWRGVLAPEKGSFQCWGRGFPMTVGDSLRCSNRSCKRQPRLRARFIWAGEQIDYKQFLCICFCVGPRICQGSAIQFVQSNNTSLAKTRHRVDNIYGDLRVPLAWREHRLSRRRRYNSAAVEPDACRAGSSNTDAAPRRRALALTP